MRLLNPQPYGNPVSSVAPALWRQFVGKTKTDEKFVFLGRCTRASGNGRAGGYLGAVLAIDHRQWVAPFSCVESVSGTNRL
jgi:hypothetical protein